VSDGSSAGGPVIAPLAEADLPEAARILRNAFATFMNVPEPETFWSDRDYVHGRWRAPHVAALGAKLNGALAGSNFAVNWGSVGFFGPLSVRADIQQRGIAKALLAATMDQFDAWGTRHTGLFTFANSPKHIALYQKFGFEARFLTAILSGPVGKPRPIEGWTRYSELREAQKDEALRGCREVTESITPGLDLSEEIKTVEAQTLGDTVLLQDGDRLAGFAVCHHGPRSEAGAGTCFIKFGAVRDTPSAERDFSRLLEAGEALAAAAGMANLLAGANMGRREAYQHLVARGFRTAIQGVAMHRRNDPGTCRPGAYIIDDWR
jgi:GNAT superfamily N-acetyltransferase